VRRGAGDGAVSSRWIDGGKAWVIRHDLGAVTDLAWAAADVAGLAGFHDVSATIVSRQNFSIRAATCRRTYVLLA
jgi:hypothetical protein